MHIWVREELGPSELKKTAWTMKLIEDVKRGLIL